MSGEDGDTESSPRDRRPGLRAFLPLSEEISFSTRGQNLPGLMRSLSSTPRRASTYRGYETVSDEETIRRSGETERRRSWDFDTFEERRLPGEERRVSNAALVLMTPQMRSQRLIGNSNPRYKWYETARYYGGPVS
jgi:hypothetical protein